MKPLRLLHLYPRRMNIYGDRGNIMTLTRRAAWRGLEITVDSLDVGEARSLKEYDLLFFGGGQDQEQPRVSVDLQRHREALIETVEDGAALLAVCGGYQLLGHYYQPAEGQRLSGIGLFDAFTEAGPTRMIGNVVATPAISELGEAPIVGFENHSGQTFLNEGARALATVRFGGGNNGQDGTEGCVYRHAIGTYLHGSVLPKNPQLADWLLEAALRRRQPDARLSMLDDDLEQAANASLAHRFS